MKSYRRPLSLLTAVALPASLVVLVPATTASADLAPQPLPFTQDWSDAELITANDDWSGVPGIVGYLGADLASRDEDPQTVLTPESGIEGVFEDSSPGISEGGVHEVEDLDTVALHGSGTTDAPSLVITVNTSGVEDVRASYRLRDLDSDNGGAQQVALHYRVGQSGEWTNVPEAYVADASQAQGASFQVNAALPAEAGDVPVLQLRIMTTDTFGADSMTGVDDIVVEADDGTTPPTPPAAPVADCEPTLVTTTGEPASTPVSATDADSTFVSVAITSPAVPGITMEEVAADSASAVLTVSDAVAVGTYDVVVEFTTTDEPAQSATCSVEVTVRGPAELVLVSDVQGEGAASPREGARLAVEAVVTALITTDDALSGFFVQEEEADEDAAEATSEGVFVFCGSACPDGLAAGDLVRVEGTVEEYFGMTRVSSTAGDIETVSTGNPLPPAAVVELPADGSTSAEATFENVEGMRTTIPTTLALSEYFEHARFGSLVLTANERPYQFTHVSEPSVEGYAAFLADLETRRIILDDDSTDQNDATSDGPDEPYPYPSGGLSVDDRFRGGDTIDDLTGVMEWSFGQWRLRPVAGEDYSFTSVDEAPASPEDVGGSLQVGSFNVLNYFTTIDETSSDNAGPCGPAGTADCRGADSGAELERQRAKIVSALVEMDADVVGLIEIQNDDDASVADVVAGLNAAAGAGTYAYVATGTTGTDAIKQAFIYQPVSVTPVGDFAVLDSSADPRFVDTANRPALVQTFEEAGTGERVTVAVNHLKSKGSDCDDLGDPDVADGQANCNETRTAAAEALADFLATDPTGSGDPDFLIIGDLNAYRMEDPIRALEGAGYTDLLARFEGDGAYSYVFDGQLGYLDHGLANEPLLGQVTGATAWHINADENPLFDYNDTVRDAGEAAFERKSTARELYAPGPLRSSDHDPVLIGLDLGSPEPANTVPVADAGGPYEVRVGRVIRLDASDSTDADDDELTYAWDLDGDGKFDDAEGARPELAGRGRGPGTYEVVVQVDDGTATSTDTAVVEVVTPGRGPKNR